MTVYITDYIIYLLHLFSFRDWLEFGTMEGEADSKLVKKSGVKG